MTQILYNTAHSEPAVSVIIPCYRATDFIGQALDSLRAQTFRNFETILVNDCCPDTVNLERVLEPYRDEIVYLKHDVNQGPSAARNTGIRAAGAPLISMLDSDDVWAPNYLEVQTAMIAANPDADVVYPDAEFFGGHAWSGKTFMEMNPSRGEVNFRSILKRECNVFIGVMARRDALVGVGLFDPMLRRAEDFDLWLRLARAGSKFIYHPARLVRYRLSHNSLSDEKISLQRANLQVYTKLSRLPDLTDEEKHLLADAIRLQRAAIDWFLGKKALYSRDRREALVRLSNANAVFKGYRTTIMIWLLRLWPGLLYRYVHSQYSSEYSYLH